jgi:hypothetical protein
MITSSNSLGRERDAQRRSWHCAPRTCRSRHKGPWKAAPMATPSVSHLDAREAESIHMPAVIREIARCAVLRVAIRGHHSHANETRHQLVTKTRPFRSIFALVRNGKARQAKEFSFLTTQLTRWRPAVRARTGLPCFSITSRLATAFRGCFATWFASHLFLHSKDRLTLVRPRAVASVTPYSASRCVFSDLLRRWFKSGPATKIFFPFSNIYEPRNHPNRQILKRLPLRGTGAVAP